MEYRSSHSVNMVDGIVEVISKPEFLEVSHTDFYSHISLINIIVSEDSLEILAEFDNSSNAEANASEIEQFIHEKSGEIITASTEKKIPSLSKNMTSKACQVNFNEMNIETCYRSGCQSCKCVNGPIKGDTALHKKNNDNQNTDDDPNSFSITSINNCATSKNDVIRTTEIPK